MNKLIFFLGVAVLHMCIVTDSFGQGKLRFEGLINDFKDDAKLRGEGKVIINNPDSLLLVLNNLVNLHPQSTDKAAIKMRKKRSDKYFDYVVRMSILYLGEFNGQCVEIDSTKSSRKFYCDGGITFSLLNKYIAGRGVMELHHSYVDSNTISMRLVYWIDMDKKQLKKVNEYIETAREWNLVSGTMEELLKKELMKLLMLIKREAGVGEWRAVYSSEK